MFVVSAEIRKMRPVVQLTVWRVPLFKADFYCKSLHRLKRVDVLCKIRIPIGGRMLDGVQCVQDGVSLVIRRVRIGLLGWTTCRTVCITIQQASKTLLWYFWGPPPGFLCTSSCSCKSTSHFVWCYSGTYLKDTSEVRTPWLMRTSHWVLMLYTSPTEIRIRTIYFGPRGVHIREVPLYFQAGMIF